jgi:hypothetical protein
MNPTEDPVMNASTAPLSLAHPMGEGWGEGTLSAPTSGTESRGQAPPHDPLPSEGRGNQHPSSTTDKKIARLPKPTRDMINVMLEDGLPYHVLIEELGEAGQGLSVESLAAWVQGRYHEYLKDRDTMEHIKARKEFASDLLRELGDADPDLIYRACRVVAALQIFEAILEYGDETLRKMLHLKPATYLTMLNTLCNHSAK